VLRANAESKLHLWRFHLQPHRNGEHKIAATASVILLVKKEGKKKEIFLRAFR